MRADNSSGKGTSGKDKFGSVVDRMNMKLGSKFLNCLRIKPLIMLAVSSLPAESFLFFENLDPAC